MKCCPHCERENPSAANHCMYCGMVLVSEEQLTEEAKLLKIINELKKENALKTKLLDSSFSLNDESNSSIVDKTTTTSPPIIVDDPSSSDIPQLSNDKKFLHLFVILATIALIVFGLFYYNNIYLPAKIDREAPRFYTFADITNLRSSKIVGVDYNRIGSLNYGSELITYKHDTEWSEVKDAAGNKGFISSNYLLDALDFYRFNSIFGDVESKQCINTTKCRLALLNYFKDNNLDSGWKTFCRPKHTKPNNVFFPRIYNKNSKYTDFAVIIKNIITNERKILIFGFNEDESLVWTRSGNAPSDGYIQNIKLINGEIYVEYSN